MRSTFTLPGGDAPGLGAQNTEMPYLNGRVSLGIDEILREAYDTGVQWRWAKFSGGHTALAYPCSE